MSNLTVYSASAGSGKTYTLAREYILLVIRYPQNYRSILAVTFTNKATEEMKQRILSELNDLAVYSANSGAKAPNYMPFLIDELGDSIAKSLRDSGSSLTVEQEISRRALAVRTSVLHDYTNFAISTIDKFFQKVVRNFVNELNIQPGYALELDTDKVLTLAVDRVLEGLYEDETLQRWLFDLVQERLDVGDSWELSDILHSLGRELLGEQYQNMSNDFVAKIGDKEFLEKYYKRLTEKDRELDDHYKNIGSQALAFLDANGLSPNDFPGKSRSFATIFQKAADGTVPTSYKTVSDAYNNPDKWLGAKGSKITDAVYRKLNPVLGEILNYINCECNRYKIIIKNFRTLGVLADIDRQIRQLATDENLLLISDTNTLINKLIEDTDAPFIYEKIGNRYSSFLIDEFQDTSKVQYNNFKPLLENSIGAGGHNLVVGDVKQSIYRWRNGDWTTLGVSVLEDFEADKVVLDTNFRSQKTVVEFNNGLFPILAEAVQTDFNAQVDDKTRTSALTGIYCDVAQKVPDVPSKQGGYVRLEKIDGEEESTTSDRNDEILSKMIDRVLSLQHDFGYKASDIAILVRRQKEGQMVAQALLEAKANADDSSAKYFNFISQGALFLTSSSAVNLIVAVLRLAVGEQVSVNSALIASLNALENDGQLSHGSFSADQNERLSKILERIDSLPLVEAVETIIAEYNLNKNAAELPFIGDFCDLVLNFADRKTADIRSFVEWWNTKGASVELYLPGKEEAITILTIHKSKGLQYKVVLMPFCSWSLDPSTGLHTNTLWVDGSEVAVDGNSLEKLPVQYGTDLKNSPYAADAFEELLQSNIDNVNLAYVALTRAERELYVYIPRPTRGKSIGTYLFDSALVLASNSSNSEVNEDQTVVEFGKPSSVTYESKPSDDDSTLPLTYQIGTPMAKIRQQFQASSAEGAQSIKKGLYMHRLFSMIETVGDISDAVSTLVGEGLIVDAERNEVTSDIKKRIAELHLEKWFDGSCEIINECDIILPGDNYRVRRPDRVMKGDNETIVVDFKFGAVERDSYIRQIRNYIYTLGKMNMPNVHGYIWYFDLNKVEAVG